MSTHLKTGRIGESIAKTYLEHKGYRVLYANVRVGRRDEIDIVAFDPVDSVFVFAEVKTRTRFSLNYHPELNLTPTKKHALLRSARTWVEEMKCTKGYRIDLICVAGGRVLDHYIDVDCALDNAMMSSCPSELSD